MVRRPQTKRNEKHQQPTRLHQLLNKKIGLITQKKQKGVEKNVKRNDKKIIRKKRSGKSKSIRTKNNTARNTK